MGISICLASGKDGTGKSIITANLGFGLSNMGIKSLVVDGDIKGASINLLVGDMDQNTPTIQDLLSRKIRPEEAISEAFGLQVVFGAVKINQLMGISLDELPSLIEHYCKDFEIVLVDSPGGLGNDTLMVISSCQFLILVLTPDLNSIIHTIKTIVMAKKVGSDILRVIINRSGSPYDIPSDQVSDFLRVNVLGEIIEDEQVKKSVHEAVPTVMGYPQSNFSQQIKEIAKMISELY